MSLLLQSKNDCFFYLIDFQGNDLQSNSMISEAPLS
jgi:hypothetical protein